MAVRAFTVALGIAALVAGALAFACREHRRDGRRLTALFSALAAKYGGEVRPGYWLVLPQLRFERDGGRYLVAAMASSGRASPKRLLSNTANRQPMTEKTDVYTSMSATHSGDAAESTVASSMYVQYAPMLT